MDASESVLLPMIEDLARRALGESVGPASGGGAWEKVGLPAARKLLGETGPGLEMDLSRAARALRASQGRTIRPVYGLLVAHLQLSAMGPLAGLSPLVRHAEQHVRDGQVGDVSVSLWSALVALQAQQSIDDAQLLIDAILNRAGEDGVLHAMSVDDSLDAWTYRELTGLHALGHVVRLWPTDKRRTRLAEVATYHLRNTQPDHTTHEPWGLHVFAGASETRLLAQQQLHDVAAGLAGVRSGGVVMGLLLADAAWALRA
ncbi:MAG: hypothetical protein IT441_04380 [Phycisphaeraceae bacterium]|nr:hypothetical protein [Phycisphaeraceae bacterium]